MSSTPKTESLFELTLEIGERQDVGATPRGRRLIVQIAGGSFVGPKLEGIVLPGGADWLLFRQSGVVELDVRLTLRTHAGQLIYMTYHGIDDTRPDVAQRLAKGEAVDPSAYYFRMAPSFETASEKDYWLNNIVAVGVGRKAAKGPIYSVYALV